MGLKGEFDNSFISFSATNYSLSLNVLGATLIGISE
jgi:hypothetical protein